MSTVDETTQLIRPPKREIKSTRSRYIGHRQNPFSSNQSINSSISGQPSLGRIRVACGVILVTVILERLAFYGLAGNLVLFLNKHPFTWESYHAMAGLLYFFGISFMVSIFGGWLADSILGRFKTILISLIVYTAGYILMCLIAPATNKDTDYSTVLKLCSNSTKHKRNSSTSSIGITEEFIIASDTSPFDEHCATFVYIGLTVIAIGTGCFRANTAPFGADQLAGEGQVATLGFFNWFYWCINLGALIGLAAITYIEQQESFFYGYITCTVALAVGTISFIIARIVFVSKPPEPDGSVLSKIFRIICEAWKMKRKRSRARLVNRQHGFCVDEAETERQKVGFLDYAKHRYGGSFHDSLVEDVRVLKKILVVFAVLIPYWLVYFQMQSSFLIQGLHMRLDVEKSGNGSVNSSQIVAAWLSLFDVVIIIPLLPLLDQLVYPKLEKAGYRFGVAKRIGVGMLFAVAAMVVAGVVENFRLKAVYPDPNHPCNRSVISQSVAGSVYYAADMSVFWQIPQYTLIGISEVFTSVAGLQFACSVAPKSMKGIIMGLFYLFSGVGSFLGTALISILNSAQLWFYASYDSGNINCRLCDNGHILKACHLDYFFYLLAGVGGLGFVLFSIVARVFSLEVGTTPARNPSRPTGHQPIQEDDRFQRSTNSNSPNHSIQRSNSSHSS